MNLTKGTNDFRRRTFTYRRDTPSNCINALCSVDTYYAVVLIDVLYKDDGAGGFEEHSTIERLGEPHHLYLCPSCGKQGKDELTDYEIKAIEKYGTGVTA